MFFALWRKLTEDLFSNMKLLFSLNVQRQDERTTSWIAKTIICLKTYLTWPRSAAAIHFHSIFSLQILIRPLPIHLVHQFQIPGDLPEEVREHNCRAGFTHNLHIYLRNTSQGGQSGSPDPFSRCTLISQQVIGRLSWFGLKASAV